MKSLKIPITNIQYAPVGIKADVSEFMPSDTNVFPRLLTVTDCRLTIDLPSKQANGITDELLKKGEIKIILSSHKIITED